MARCKWSLLWYATVATFLFSYLNAVWPFVSHMRYKPIYWYFWTLALNNIVQQARSPTQFESILTHNYFYNTTQELQRLHNCFIVKDVVCFHFLFLLQFEIIHFIITIHNEFFIQEDIYCELVTDYESFWTIAIWLASPLHENTSHRKQTDEWKHMWM